MMENKDLDIDEGHIKIILYNCLCALNILHTTKVFHRDIKPGNILIDSECNIKICDFGLSRVLPKKTELQTNIRKLQKSLNLIGNDQELG
jgi:mitogen-activated protein kinase 1/3